MSSGFIHTFGIADGIVEGHPSQVASPSDIAECDLTIAADFGNGQYILCTSEIHVYLPLCTERLLTQSSHFLTTNH